MKILITTLLVLSFQAFAALPESWLLARENNDVKIYKLKSNHEVMVTVQKRTHSSPMDWRGFSQEAFYRKYKKDKESMLSLIGISEWKIENHHTKKHSELLELETFGSYLSADQTKVSFREVHYYHKDYTVQVLLSAPAVVKLNKKDQANLLAYIAKEFKVFP